MIIWLGWQVNQRCPSRVEPQALIVKTGTKLRAATIAIAAMQMQAMQMQAMQISDGGSGSVRFPGLNEPAGLGVGGWM
jgi:hypothetical protein